MHCRYAMDQFTKEEGISALRFKKGFLLDFFVRRILSMYVLLLSVFACFCLSSAIQYNAIELPSLHETGDR